MACWLVMRRVTREKIGVGDVVFETDCSKQSGDIESLMLDKREMKICEKQMKNNKYENRLCYMKFKGKSDIKKNTSTRNT